jgi:hypothetical protein
MVTGFSFYTNEYTYLPEEPHYGVHKTDKSLRQQTSQVREATQA